MTATSHSPSWIAAMRVRDMEHERRAAEDRGVDVGGRDAEIFAQDSPEVRLCVAAQIRPSTSFSAEAAILERAGDALRHQIDDVHPAATWPRSLSAAPTIAAPPRFRPLMACPPPG